MIGGAVNCREAHEAEHRLHGSPGDASHRPETRGVAALLTMRVLELTVSDLILRRRAAPSRRM